MVVAAVVGANDSKKRSILRVAVTTVKISIKAADLRRYFSRESF